MSFGYAVGDVVAVLGLIERIAVEIRNYRDAPQHFQQLQAELDMHRTTIQDVLGVEPDDAASFVIVQRIRAVALHCRAPLQQFINQMHSQERALGHFRTTRSLAAIGTRLHWSLVARKDVDELRNTLLSGMLAISVLQGRLQVLQIQKLGPEIGHFAKVQSQHLAEFSREMDLLRTTAEQAPRVISELKMSLDQDRLERTGEIEKIDRKMEVIQSSVKLISEGFCAAREFGQGLGNKLTAALGQLFALMAQLRKLMETLAKTSGDIRRAVSQNVSLLLDIRREMRGLARSMKAISPRLSLDIIQFDDALGESWALPFQACAAWSRFIEMLEVVVFGNGRPGSARVKKGQFALRIANRSQDITSVGWNNFIQPNMHIEQWMVVPDFLVESKSCPFPDCSGTLPITVPGGEAICSSCRRSATAMERYQGLVALDKPIPTTDFPLSPSITDSVMQDLAFRRMTVPKLTSIHTLEEEIVLFRRVQGYRSVEPIDTWEEAQDILRTDNNDARANQFMGWYYLATKDDPESAEPYLWKASELRTRDLMSVQSYYLLGRAQMAQGKLEQGYSSYQQAIYWDGRNPACWISIAIMYHYYLKSPVDALQALARSIELNHTIWEAWVNLGVLYDSMHHFIDARDAYQRCIELNPESLEAKLRLDADKSPVVNQYGLIMIEPSLRHVNGRYSTRRKKHLNSIGFRGDLRPHRVGPVHETPAILELKLEIQMRRHLPV